MTSKCTNPNCFIDEGESCIAGHINLNDCTQFSSDSSKSINQPSEQVDDGARVPWSGSALGLSDLLTLKARSRSILVGVLGSHDSGKTTLLLGNYLLCLQGNRISEAKFAGSWTLGAWESLASWPRFNAISSSPQFPPHTPRSAERSPGLLHIALKKTDHTLRDILLTDAPGEWFSNWSINEAGNSSAGARWTVENSDSFLILADCERLSGSSRGQARKELRQLFERLCPYVGNRPVTLVWAKSDVVSIDQLPQQIVESIKRSLLSNIPHAKELSTSVKDPSTLTSALESAIDPLWHPPLAKALQEPTISNNPYAVYRGHHEGT